MRPRDWVLPESYRRSVMSIGKREIMHTWNPLAVRYSFAYSQRQTLLVVCLFYLVSSVFIASRRILSPLAP
jgi:hypothetical protein